MDEKSNDEIGDHEPDLSYYLMEPTDELFQARDDLDEKHPFPKELLNYDACIKSTEIFARIRAWNDYPKMARNEESPNQVINFNYNPIMEEYVTEYPLPIGIMSILQCYIKNDWWAAPKEIVPTPLVEKENAYAGLAFSNYSENACGWFIGLVKVYDQYSVPFEEWLQLTEVEQYWLKHSKKFEFIEGMILLEGKLDESVIRQLKDYEKYYNKNILGKIITGRPRSDPEYWLEPARAKLRGKPDITQDELAYEIGCDLKTFKINRKNGGFATFQAFKDSVLKP